MNTVYNTALCEFTDEGKSGLVKQSTGLMFSVVGAVLFSDYKNKINIEKLNEVTWKYLQENTQIIFPKVTYNYEGGFYIPDEIKFKDAIKNPLNYLIPVKNSYHKFKMTYDVLVRPNTINIINTQNTDLLFDGVAILGVPYKQDKTDLDHPLIDEQSIFVLAVEYFPDEKIKILKNQNKKLVFNIELHISLVDDVELEIEYQNNMNAGLHKVNNGSTNKKLKNISSLGGTTKLLLR